MPKKKRRKSKKKSEYKLLKSLWHLLPACVIILIVTIGIFIGALIETGNLDIDEYISDTPFISQNDNHSSDNTSSSTTTTTKATESTTANTSTDMTADAMRFQVIALDVGQADCFIIYADGTSILIDAGTSDYSDKVIAKLESLGVTTIDYIIATHPHADHIGGMADVINAFDYGTLITPKLPDDLVPSTSCYEKMLKAISNKGLKMTAAKAGNVYDIAEIDGVQVTMTILAPVDDASYTDLNSYSVVARIDYGDVSYLFVGDSTEESEADLLNSGADIDVNMLKVGHHGSKYASTSDFLAAVSPNICIISVGAGNSYGHPTDEALARLKAVTSNIYRTDESGTITLYSDGANLYVMTEN